MSTAKSIAIITGSTRTPRVGVSIASFIKTIIETNASLEGITLSSIDLADFKLPVYDEPNVPAMIPDPESYTHEHSKRWARDIARHDGYVLISPEYNYGIPGGVKNAIDYIFHPWKGKPIALVTYGLSGGKHASDQLEYILSRMGLKVASVRPQLPFIGGPTGADTGAAMISGELGKSSLDDWSQRLTEDIIKAFEEVQKAVVA
ncbi:hypothetical protein PV08_07904 [Exophiala spinifera]|uniref:NADPH-dependent FMN reductase-like domain-containing protein n=1 Tax=Exophiala spinifera TaxID=91928 RepID=A0A0D1ZQQ1_9EURO|nr:uncharacterized protein PV08_07904 [Exophiala spinifera]KIW15117.1 hypothetical protein PV08_07904 [Exophiala spinifera]